MSALTQQLEQLKKQQQELEERIQEGNILFTPDEEFLRRVAERKKKD